MFSLDFAGGDARLAKHTRALLSFEAALRHGNESPKYAHVRDLAISYMQLENGKEYQKAYDTVGGWVGE